MAYAEELSEDLRVTQLGIESTGGTAVAATKRFHSLKLDVNKKKNVREVRAAGSLLPTNHSVGKGWTDFSGKGDLSVPDMAYLLALAVNGSPTATTPMGATDARDLEYLFNSRQKTLIKTATLEDGHYGAGLADQIPFAFLNDFEINVTADKSVDVSVKGLCRQKVTGQTLTAEASVASLANGVIPVTGCAVYLETSEGALGDTELEPMKIKLSWKKSRNLVYKVSTQPSFNSIVQTAPDIQWEITVPKGSAANTFLAALDAATLYYLQILFSGPEVEDGMNNELEITTPVRFMSPDDVTDQNVRSVKFIANANHDDLFNSGNGGAFRARVRSLLAAIS